MLDGEGSRTRVSLLNQLVVGGADSAGWGVFVDRYGRLLYRWCRRWGAADSDAQDVIQDTLLVVVRQIESFQYDPSGSFRAWLKTIAYRCWLRVVERRDRSLGVTSGRAGGSWEALATVPAREDLLESLDQWARQEILDLAMSRVRTRVEPVTWEAFHLTAMGSVEGGEVARRLGLSAGAVYMAGFRIRKMLRDEIVRLDPDH